MIKVGQKIHKSKKQFRRVSYKEVPFDETGWVSTEIALPADGDLSFVKVDGVEKGSGWTWGRRWDGVRLKKNDKVSHWKRNQDKDVIKDER